MFAGWLKHFFPHVYRVMQNYSITSQVSIDKKSMSILLKVRSNVKSEINLVLTSLHTISRHWKGLAKQNCDSIQHAAVEDFLALLSAQMMTENNNH